MMKISTTQKVGIGAVVVFLLCAVGYVFFFKHIYALNEELHTVEKELAVLDILEQNKMETLSLLENTKEKREEMQTYFVSIEDPTSFLENVELLAKDTGVTLEVESLHVEDVKNKVLETQKEVVVNLSVQGRWDRLYRFVSLLETMPYVTTIERVTFTVGNEGDMHTWEGMITLRSIAI